MLQPGIAGQRLRGARPDDVGVSIPVHYKAARAFPGRLLLLHRLRIERPRRGVQLPRYRQVGLLLHGRQLRRDLVVEREFGDILVVLELAGGKCQVQVGEVRRLPPRAPRRGGLPL